MVRHGGCLGLGLAAMGTQQQGERFFRTLYGEILIARFLIFASTYPWHEVIYIP